MLTTTRSRIALVEDHRLLAETVGLALQAEGYEVVVATLADDASVLASIAADAATLVLLDLDLGELGDATRFIEPLVAADAAVLVVTGTPDLMRIAATIEAGAVGYLSKDAPFEELLDVTMRAAGGESIMDPNHRYQLLADLRTHRAAERRKWAPFETLTARERQVLLELGDGKSVEAIAGEWVVSTATVRTQVRGILTKLEVNSQLAAVAKAQAAGVISALRRASHQR